MDHVGCDVGVNEDRWRTACGTWDVTSFKSRFFDEDGSHQDNWSWEAARANLCFREAWCFADWKRLVVWGLGTFQTWVGELSSWLSGAFAKWELDVIQEEAFGTTPVGKLFQDGSSRAGHTKVRRWWVACEPINGIGSFEYVIVLVRP